MKREAVVLDPEVATHADWVRAQHIHHPDGRCLHNRFGVICGSNFQRYDNSPSWDEERETYVVKGSMNVIHGTPLQDVCEYLAADDTVGVSFEEVTLGGTVKWTRPASPAETEKRLAQRAKYDADTAERRLEHYRQLQVEYGDA